MCILFNHPHRRDEFGRHRNRFAAPDADDADDGLQLRDRHVELAAAVRADDPQCRFVFHEVMLSRRRVILRGASGATPSLVLGREC